MIKAVIFDVDGVLIDSFEANLKFYHDLFIKAGYKPLSREKYKKFFHGTLKELIKEVTESKDEDEIQRIWLMGKNRKVPYPNELLGYPDKLESTVKDLGKKYILAIVTSRISDSFFKFKKLINLRESFGVVVYYGDTEKHKPDPEPLLLALERLNLRPEEAVYVGDTRSDIQAGKAAGMKVVICSRSNLKGADSTVKLFRKLPDIIGSLE